MTVKQLKDLVEDPTKREKIINDCVVLVEEEVASKRGLSGAVVKAAYMVVKKIKPGIIRESVDNLCDEFIGQAQPFYEKYQEEGEKGTLEQYFRPRTSEVAEALLGVTDRRAERATNRAMVKAYNKLRPKGKQHVEAAVPGVGRMLDKSVGLL